MKKFYFLLLIFTTSLFFLSSCNNDKNETDAINLVSSHKNDVIVQWNNLFLEIERYAGGFRPGPAPRAMGLIGLATYEACLTGMPDYKSVAILYPGLSIPKSDPGVTYHWP
jgi:hypothetical protein